MARSKSLPIPGVQRPTIVDGSGAAHELHESGRHRRRSLTRTERASAWIGDRLPLALRGRFAVGGRELGLVALAGALALCVAAGLALRSSAAAATPTTRAPQLVAASTTHTRSTSGAPLVTAVGRAHGTVVIDIAGAVVHPRVVTLPAGSRVFEALKAAGGVRHGVDLTSLNLARVVVDGEQIVVGRRGSTTSPGPKGSSVVSLNSATEQDLDALPGIGPVTAKSIVAWRQQHGSFTKVDELEEIDGIGPKTFAKLKPLVGL